MVTKNSQDLFLVHILITFLNTKTQTVTIMPLLKTLSHTTCLPNLEQLKMSDKVLMS